MLPNGRAPSARPFRTPGRSLSASGVGIGARDEPAALAGASHFLEHLLFKGTPSRSARAIAEEVDAVGGEMNAFTAKEHTAYYTPAARPRTSRFGLELLVDVLSDPAFRPGEVDAERQVILEEILLSYDMPDDRVHTVLFEALYPHHPLGREVLGDASTVEDLRPDQIADFFQRWYTPRNLVVAVAGNVTHDRVVRGVERYLADVDPGAPAARQTPDAPTEPLRVERRETEQAHVALGWHALDYDDPDRYALAVANHALGGGLSSRLFQEVREERGLAYTVYSAPTAFTDSGALTVYVGTGPSRVDESVRVINGVIEELLDTGITAQELDVARGYLEGSLVLGLEDSGSRMGRLGASETIRGEVITVDEHVERIRAVTGEDVARVLDRVLAGDRVVAAVGPVDEDSPALRVAPSG
ncbi:MAG: pitrilysin family protein [Acidimicrobiia bacterium]|nr:pitrilysin family protein [Acidimicrobiia bacterium]